MFETNRKMANLITVGIVCEIFISETKHTAKVDINGRVSDELPILSFASKHLKVSTPFEIGQQVVVLFPDGGDWGVIVGSLYSQKITEPSIFTDGVYGCEFENGTKIYHDINANKTNIITSGEVNIAGKVTINGDLHVNGKITDSKGAISDLRTEDSRGDIYQR